MQDTTVTFAGWVGGEVRHRLTREDTSVAEFRVGVTSRQRKDGGWVDGPTTWYTVTAWRTLADNVRQSLRKGDPVIVTGRLHAETWTRDDGSPAQTLKVEATSVGHDLNRGCTHWWRGDRPQEPAAPGPVAPAGPLTAGAVEPPPEHDVPEPEGGSADERAA